jgi:DNA-binding protein YbaB
VSELPPGPSRESIVAMLESVAERNKVLTDLQDRIAAVRGEGTSADGRVVVEVMPSGALAALKIDPRAMRLGSEALAEQIMAASRDAAQSASEQTNELMGALANGFAGVPDGLGLQDLGLEEVLASLDEVDRRLGR